MILCEYGCGKEAKHQFKNGKWCCSETTNKCLGFRKISSVSHSGKKQSKDLVEKRISKLRGKEGRKLTDEEKKKIGDRTRGKKQSEETIRKKIISLTGKKRSKEFSDNLRLRMLNGQALYMLKFKKNPSKNEVKLRSLVQIIYPNCEFQHQVLNYLLDIAIPEYKIAIEYDGWYHFDTQDHIDYHFRRQKKIEEQGWKFIRYSMFNKFPSIEQIRDSIKTIIEQEEKS